MQPTENLSPSILVIFGITGDLAKRKVLPALFQLVKQDLLPEKTVIIGTSRREITVDEVLQDVDLGALDDGATEDSATIDRFRDHLRVLKVDPLEGADYDNLHKTLDDIEAAHGVCMNRLYYLSIPPQVYGPIIRALGEHNMNASCIHGSAQTRLLVEKPFGYDLTSANELITETGKVFGEQQIFRIDHYLAKDTAQNILTFRQKNPLFADIWNNQHITSISVKAYEKIGIENRANFYDSIGAMRDFVQSHLLQLLAITTMDLPENLDNGDAIHATKQRLLEATHLKTTDGLPTNVIRAQYNDYRNEVGKADTTTETFVAIEVAIDLPQWQGVPIILTTGKALAEKRTEIDVVFGSDNQNEQANRLNFRIQPQEGIDVTLLVKKPGYSQETQATLMDFSYQTTFNEQGHPDAYERVLVDAVRGDHLLFATGEEVIASWKILQPILDHWQRGSDDLRFYAEGVQPDSITNTP